jgi:hypothetical protein
VSTSCTILRHTVRSPLAALASSPITESPLTSRRAYALNFSSASVARTFAALFSRSISAVVSILDSARFCLLARYQIRTVEAHQLSWTGMTPSKARHTETKACDDVGAEQRRESFRPPRSLCLEEDHRGKPGVEATVSGDLRQERVQGKNSRVEQAVGRCYQECPLLCIIFTQLIHPRKNCCIQPPSARKASTDDLTVTHTHASRSTSRQP